MDEKQKRFDAYVNDNYGILWSLFSDYSDRKRENSSQFTSLMAEFSYYLLDKISEAISPEAYREFEELFMNFGYYNELEGFIDGFSYAMSLNRELESLKVPDKTNAPETAATVTGTGSHGA